MSNNPRSEHRELVLTYIQYSYQNMRIKEHHGR